MIARSGATTWPFETLRDRLRSGQEGFVHLDAAQLVKHAFGLVTDARRLGKRPALAYAYAEPKARGENEIAADTLRAHRDEIHRFCSLVQGAEVQFAAFSYREWLSEWPVDPDVKAHGRALAGRFDI